MSKTAVAGAASLVLIAVLAGAASLVFITMSAGGCTTHQCDPSTSTLGLDASPDGSLGVGLWDLECFAPNPAATSTITNTTFSGDCTLTWRTSPFVGTWLPFSGQKTYTFVFPPLPPLPPGATLDFANAYPIPYVSIEPLLSFGDGNIALATGANVEITGYQASSLNGGPDGGPTRGSLTVFNPACADYFIQVTLAGIEVEFDGGTSQVGPDGGLESAGLDGGQGQVGLDASMDQ